MGLSATKEQLRLEENHLRSQVALLSAEQKKHFYGQTLQHIKDPDTYAVLNWIFLAGLHHFYLGKWQRGLFNFVLMLIGTVLFFSGIFTGVGIVLILVIFVIELPQLFNSENVVHRYNNGVMKSLLKQYEGD